MNFRIRVPWIGADAVFLSTLPEGDRESIKRHLKFARHLHIETRILEGLDTAPTLVDFARRNQITQIFLARPRDRKWFPLLSGT